VLSCCNVATSCAARAKEGTAHYGTDCPRLHTLRRKIPRYVASVRHEASTLKAYLSLPHETGPSLFLRNVTEDCYLSEKVCQAVDPCGTRFRDRITHELTRFYQQKGLNYCLNEGMFMTPSNWKAAVRLRIISKL
jgi:hypothetical protein